jgi:hypothetical protein
MKTYQKLLITVYAINATAAIATIITLAFMNGYHSKVPFWFNAWALPTFVFPPVAAIFVILYIQIIKMWKR